MLVWDDVCVDVWVELTLEDTVDVTELDIVEVTVDEAELVAEVVAELL